MDVRKLNVGLTVELMNNREGNTALSTIKNFMSGVKEAGKFLGTKLTNERTLGNEWKNTDYTLNFENCSLDINMTANLNTRREMVRGFKFT